MKYEYYTDIKIGHELRKFEFNSFGKYGVIPKRISFEETHLPEVYNMIFGNINDEDEIDDLAVSDNGDRDKVLATIAKVVEIYTTTYPQRAIYFRGSTKQRTRLYRMAVGLNLEELSEKFEIFAIEVDDGQFMPFRKNKEVFAFLIKKKIV